MQRAHSSVLSIEHWIWVVSNYTILRYTEGININPQLESSELPWQPPDCKSFLCGRVPLSWHWGFTWRGNENKRERQHRHRQYLIPEAATENKCFPFSLDRRSHLGNPLIFQQCVRVDVLRGRCLHLACIMDECLSKVLQKRRQKIWAAQWRK